MSDNQNNQVSKYTHICSGSISNLLSKIYDGDIEYNDNYSNILIRVSETNRLHLRNLECEDFMQTEIVLHEIHIGDLQQYENDDIKEVEVINNVIPILRQYDTNDDGKKRINLLTLGDVICVPSLTPERFNINQLKFDLYLLGQNGEIKNPFKQAEIINTEHINPDDVIKQAEINMLKEC